MNIENLKLRREEILDEMRDPDFNKDIRENSTRSATLSEFETINNLIDEYENDLSLGVVSFPPGTVGYDMLFTIKYIEILSNGESKKIPPPFNAKVSKDTYTDDVCKLWSGEDVIIISDKSLLGTAILGKIPSEFLVNTSSGYVRMELSL